MASSRSPRSSRSLPSSRSPRLIPPGQPGVPGYPGAALPPGAPALPGLPTLFERPSWVSWSGRPDRSACAEVRVGELWRGLTFQPMCTAHGAEARAFAWLRAEELERRQAGRPQRMTQGDYRWKAHAMQPGPIRYGQATSGAGGGGASGGGGEVAKALESWDRHRRWRRSLKTFRQAEPGLAAPLIPHPARGWLPERILGLGAGWEQRVEVQRWAIGTFDPRGRNVPINLVRNRATQIDGVIRRHYLVCPGRELHQRPTVWVPDAAVVTPTPRQRQWWGLDQAPTWRPACTGKAYKLFLPLCTPEEYRDAQAAQAWLAAYRRRRPNAPGSALEALLIARYGPLFGPRRLVCQRCLGLVYGKVRMKKFFPKVKWKPVVLPILADYEEELAAAERRLRCRFPWKPLKLPSPDVALRNPFFALSNYIKVRALNEAIRRRVRQMEAKWERGG